MTRKCPLLCPMKVTNVSKNISGFTFWVRTNNKTQTNQINLLTLFKDNKHVFSIHKLYNPCFHGSPNTG